MNSVVIASYGPLILFRLARTTIDRSYATGGIEKRFRHQNPQVDEFIHR